MDTGPKQRRKVNPRVRANLFSILTFGWTLETFKHGYSNDIQENDLYEPLPEHKSDILGNALQKSWEQEVEKTRDHSENTKPSLWRALMKVFGAELVLYGIIVAAVEFLIRNNSTYFQRLFHYFDNKSGSSYGEALFYTFGVVLCSAVNVMVQHPFMMGVMHLGMKMRVGVCSLIYRKALKVSVQALSESSGGLVVNLMANDVNRFDTGPLFIHYLWIGPLETMITAVYLYREMGSAALYGMIVIIGVIPFQIFLGTRTARYRKETAIETDDRVKLMKEIILGMEVIKMYTWEGPFRKIIDTVRRQEIYFIKMTSYIRGTIMSFIMFTSRFGIFISILVYVMFSYRVTAETVFFLTCYYNILKQTMTLFFPQAVGQVAEMNVAIGRIRDYLLSEECNLSQRQPLNAVLRNEENPKKRVTIIIEPVKAMHISNLSNTDDPSTSSLKKRSKEFTKNQTLIEFENASTRWIKSVEKEDVEDITLKIGFENLITIIGAVGSGKSTLLHMILGELPCSKGKLSTNGTISYASQEPWLFVGSVRQNILFGQPFVRSRYMEVCKVCALERDMSLLPHGDKTVVGERGISLSGGQRARINLARAVYKEADIYLLDDPLSAVDTQVAKHIFERCIKRYLLHKTVILVTHQLQFIKSVDDIVVMDKGKIIATGGFDELNEKQLAIVKLMEDKGRNEVHEVEFGQAMHVPSATSTQRKHVSSIWDQSTFSQDQRPDAETQTFGRVNGTIYRDYFLSGTSWVFVLFVAFMFIISQISASASDYWICRWSYVEDQLTGDDTIDNILWNEQGLYRNSFVIIFGSITLATVFIAIIRAFLFFNVCMKSSIKLHDLMFECISLSPMHFFHINPSGRVLNRFSKDMGAVDELLPQAMLDCFQILLNLAGVIIVILVADITLLVPIVTALIIFYIFRLVYIRTTGAVKRLEGITRSPVFSHINATVLGLATIRSFNAETLLAVEFDRHQDLHSAAWYMFITCSRAFGYFLDVICFIFICCVAFGCLMKSEISSSNVGLVITQSISMTGIFQWGMRQSAEMENQMTSVERVLDYTNLPREDALRCKPERKLSSSWPEEGGIVFNELSLKYVPDGNYVLHKLTFSIEPQQKIGIVGRTGAGKSSIIQALFRLVHLEGNIFIDDEDILTMGLHDLREKLSIIPQEPVLFSGTIRKNLDPFDEFPDQLLLNALNSVEMIEGNLGQDALYKQVSDGGLNFSVGERQLVCLARAIVRNNKILVMDEATANVDAQTDALIQTAIREHFRSCTVLTIAHRLNTIIDSDKILVLDAGMMMEYDHPHLLLQNKKGHFRKMVAETGPAMAPILHKTAAENYKNAIRLQEK